MTHGVRDRVIVYVQVECKQLRPLFECLVDGCSTVKVILFIIIIIIIIIMVIYKLCGSKIVRN